MFKKILIANRGEIAVRVIKTARRLGIATVAVYSDADQGALHVEMADEAVRIGAPPPRESYLVGERIIAAAKATGAEGIHPGYGFLSENAAFAQAVVDAGLTFVGPNPKAIAAMGDKIASKKLAAAAGVNVIPGHIGEVADADAAVVIARGIGFPVMIKASGGGGGRGLRIARSDAEVREGFAAAAKEAASAFGDPRLLIEKLIENPRHIEIQVLGDKHGNLIYLGERECSIQRRNQKLIEESPSPFLDAKTRKAMGEQAVALAAAVGYDSAGTVECVVDPERNFYFLEMNTRLQVEHPVTELVTGLDLVEAMMRSAAGEPLKLDQKDVKLKGSAIEVRLCAEDPTRGFLPSIGRLKRFRPPTERVEGQDVVRVDSGVREGDAISIHYDSLIAKLIAHGKDRACAIATMADMLDGLQVEGLDDNGAFLSAVLDQKRFREGRLSTGYIAEEFPDGFALSPPDAETLPLFLSAAAVMAALEARRAGLPAQAAWAVVIEGESVEVGVELNATGALVSLPPRGGGAGVGGHDAWADPRSNSAGLESRSSQSRRPPPPAPSPQGGGGVELGEVRTLTTSWRPGQKIFRAALDGAAFALKVARTREGFALSRRGVRAELVVTTPRAAALRARLPEKARADAKGGVLSPMPGLVASVSAAPGQTVKAGEALLVIEAMKMENVVRAERDGVIKAIHVVAGASVAADALLLELE